MAQFLMSDHLSTVSADYAYTLSIAPQEDMGVEPVKNQVLKYTDDGNRLPLNLSSTTRYQVTLKWKMVPVADAKIIMDLWSSATKADGIRQSFRWYNHDDTKTYVVSFLTRPKLRLFSVGTHQTIDQVQLLVEGNYVP